MAFDKFLIAPINSGLQRDVKPFLIMDDAFELLQNAYVFRGRVRKRFGSLLMGAGGNPLNSRLRIDLGANANVAVNLPGNASQLAIGQMFSLGTDVFTVWRLGAGVTTLSTNGAVTATIDSTTNPNTVTFAGGSGAHIFYYPAEPVMGLTQYESGNVNNHPSYAFDPQFAYTFTGGAWARSGTAVWHGDSTNYFYASNWQGTTTLAASGLPIMFVSNFQVTNYNGAVAATDDPIWKFDGTTWTALSGANAFYFAPTGAIQTGPFVRTARIVLPFKNRLILLNTVEVNSAGNTNTNYVNRCRYSFNGSPFARNAWYEPNQSDNSGAPPVVDNNNLAAGAGYIDATTEEQIISAEFIKDRLIVYFERSTWELAYTGNEILPFLWQKINTELGSQSTFSTVPFDKEVLTIGNTGIHSCSGANVARIDDKIPDEIFEFQTKNNGPLRTAGIRDYFTEMVYWAFMSDNVTDNQLFANQVLVYNYKNGSWALNDDCFTCFGYFEQQTTITWASSDPLIWEEFTNTWSDGVQQANQRVILAGTPEGFVLIIDPDESNNAPSMQITNLTPAATGIVTIKAINHNLSIAGEGFGGPDYVLFLNIAGDTTISNYLNLAIYQVDSIIDANTFTINTNRVNPVTGLPQAPLISGTYTGGGTLTRVSNIQILSKQYNPYLGKENNFYIQRVDFGVERTATGEITVDYYPSATQVSMIQGGVASGSIMGNNVLETSPYPADQAPLEQFQDRLWHPIYFASFGECLQLKLYFTPQQMIDGGVVFESFELHGFIIVVQPTGRLQ